VLTAVWQCNKIIEVRFKKGILPLLDLAEDGEPVLKIEKVLERR
jgi:hypothetical protein